MQPHLLVPQQVPEFVRAEYPAFLEFIKAYYQWLDEEVSLGKVETLVDVDATVDQFLQYFRKQLDVYGITTQSNNKLYLQHIKELYAAKGSNASYDFLFKILFNKASSVTTPWDSVFIPSNGNWKQDTSILVQIPVSVDINLLEGNPIIIRAAGGTFYRSSVKNANRRSDGIVELFISRIVHQGKLVSFTPEGSAASYRILSTTLRAVIEKPGASFRIGQVFEVDSYGGAGTLCKVKAVDKSGGITAVDVIRFGVGYNTDFNLLVSPQTVLDITDFNSRITLGGLSYPTNDIASAQNEEGSIVKHDYTSFTDISDSYMADATYVGETVGEIKHQERSVYIDSNYASIKFIVGELCVYPGYYASSNNILGDIAFIQDSYYYQVFSYVTEVEESLNNYSKILRDVLHPAGTKHFGVYQINNAFQLNVQIDPTLNILIKEDAIRDFLDTVDEIIFAFEKDLAESFIVTDATAIDFSKVTTPDVAYATDAAAKHFSKALSNQTTVTDANAVDFNKSLATLFATTDVSSRSTSKVLASQAVTADSLITSVDYNRTLTGISVTLSDIPSFEFTLGQINDGVNTTDAIAIEPGIELTPDNVTISDTDTINLDKYASDGIQTGLAMSGLYMEPYYVLPDPPYWQAGYLENEREFTN